MSNYLDQPLLQYDFEESVGYWVVMTAHSFQRALNKELFRHGITYRQWQLLAWLALEGAQPQAELAEKMDVDPATLVSVLGRMQRDGWIRREGCSTDRRKRLIHPTEKSKPVWDKGVHCARRVRAQATQGFTPDQMSIVKEMLAAMRENLALPALVMQD